MGFWLGVSEQVVISVFIDLVIGYEIQEHIMHIDRK